MFQGLIAEVTEDRGPIDVGGGRLYGVKVRVDPWNEHTLELGEESLEAVDDDASSNPPPKSKGKRAVD
jgi:hypothetical protein